MDDMDYKEAYEQEHLKCADLAGRIADLEAKIAENQEQQGLCGSDFVALQQLQAELSALEEALEAKTERWMYLTELKEKIDAQGK